MGLTKQATRSRVTLNIYYLNISIRNHPSAIQQNIIVLQIMDQSDLHHEYEGVAAAGSSDDCLAAIGSPVVFAWTMTEHRLEHAPENRPVRRVVCTKCVRGGSVTQTGGCHSVSLKTEYPWGRIAVNHKRLEYSFDFTQSYSPYFSVTCSNKKSTPNTFMPCATHTSRRSKLN